jgi:predicted phosphodiesterase
MLIKPLSDIHLEFGDFIIPNSQEDKNTILVLAGDTGIVHKDNHLHERFLPFISRCANQFKHVVMIFGNHEHYYGAFQLTEEKFRNAWNHYNIYNVSILEKSSIVIDNVAFIGATLWTDCDKKNPSAHILWQQTMTDARVIRNGNFAFERKFLAEDTWNDHELAKNFIWSEVDKFKKDGKKTVVVVHHGVSNKSIHPIYKENKLNMFFSSEMTEEILKHEPDIIIHGHTHMSCEYTIGNTHVVCNPRGYEGYETDPITRGFDINKLINI